MSKKFYADGAEEILNADNVDITGQWDMTNPNNVFYGDGSNLTGLPPTVNTSIASAPPHAATGSGDAWFNLNDGKTYTDVNDGDSSQWVLENPPVVPDYGVDEALASINAASTYLPIASGQFSVNQNYFVTATATYTLPDTTGLSDGAVVALIKVQGTTPIYSVDGSNSENIIHGDETDTTATHNADSEIKFVFNNGNWEV